MLFLFRGVCCAVMTALAAGALLTGTQLGVFLALCAVSLSIGGALCVTGDGCSVLAATRHFLSVRRAIRTGRRQRDALERDTLSVRRAQEETLLRRLRNSERTHYGFVHHLGSITDSAEFRKRHPVTTYTHYEEFVRRVAAGEEKLVVTETPVLTVTSGSSGSPKMLLSTSENGRDYFSQGASVCEHVMTECFPGTASLQTTFRPLYPSAERHSKAGLRIEAAPFSSEHTHRLCTSPAAVLQVQDERDALYLHLLFALRDRNVGILECSSSSLVLDAFGLLEERWEELADDVERGRISSRLLLDARVRAELERRLRADPCRAAELKRAVSEGFEGVALRLWPRLHLIRTVDSGTHQIYAQALRQRHCRGVAFYSPLYAAAEGVMGVNLWPLQDRRQYLLCPRSMFFEFVPEERADARDALHTLLMDEVEEDKSYELIITNASGLFRYRLGDVVKVVRFHNQCPVVEFYYRRSETLNVRGEKVNEALFLDALQKVLTLWPGAKLADYCCAESGILGDSSGGAQPHYLVFLELRGVRNLTEEQRYKLDACLQADSALYRSFRIKGSIGPMRVQLVSEGAFRQLRSHVTSTCHTSTSRFQMQRVIRRKEHADFLLRKTVS